MKTVRLGRTGLEVSRVGMGSIPIQRRTRGECKEKCHYRLPIREIIKENYDFFKREIGRDV